LGVLARTARLALGFRGDTEFVGSVAWGDVPATDGGQRRMAQTLFQDVAFQAKAVLARSRIFDLRALEVEQDAECVVLRGSVESFYHKQLAQELVKTAIEGIEVINEIDVDYSRDRGGEDFDWN
jgi:hypothetical protein